jgi:hypothetical protein
MPIHYRIDSARKLVYTTFEGEITDQLVLQHANKIQSDPEIDGSFVELIDANTISMSGVSGSGLRAVAAALTDLKTIGKIAILVSRDVEFGLARMIEMLADESPTEIRVFRAEVDARSWLDVE